MDAFSYDARYWCHCEGGIVARESYAGQIDLPFASAFPDILYFLILMKTNVFSWAGRGPTSGT